MQVANLAEEAANAIGANSLLARTGALYHDIGKIKSPEYFTENQTSLSPHLGMTCEDSARKIISHVTYGLELAEKHHLPKVLCDFIRTHHGRGKASFFYITQKNKQPNVYVDPAPFTYPGPDPETPEQAILMMADSVEAASRSLKVITKEAITEQTSNIIDHLVHEGRFAHCAITLAEIEKVKETLCKKLLTINHTRIQYPELKEEESQNVQQKG